MSEPAHCEGEVCITCSDQAVPVRIAELRADDLALVDTEAGTSEEISIALVDARVGDVVLVHAKEAIARVEPTAFRADAFRADALRAPGSPG